MIVSAGTSVLDEDPLKFQVAPDIVEHLGLNLYTNLPRVLVEFVANAYDADSPYADIRMNILAIADARREMRIDDRARREKGLAVTTPLEEQYLPSNLTIVVEDRGHGMTKSDLEEKFLRIARKRRKVDNGRSATKSRVVMGRKGIGKLAGFGVAHRMEVTTRAAGEQHATRIFVDYADLIGKETMVDVLVKTETLTDGAGLDPSGTRIVLSNLVYEPTGSQESTILRKITEHFSILHPEEFEIRLNGEPLPPFEREYVYAYPDPDLPSNDLKEHSLELDDGETVTFSYRIRFTGEKKQLDSDERGVRVYAHQRLASAPDLLGLGTGMHGFQNTHYLDGVVVADFIDERQADYIASNRQTIRWDTPLLAPFRTFLRGEMQDACTQYQATKTDTMRILVRKDDFTLSTIEKEDLPPHRREIAFRIAAKLGAGCIGGVNAVYYQETLPVIVHGLGYGELLSAIAGIAQDEHPSFPDLVSTIADLTSAEWDEFARVVAARIKGIEVLRRIYKSIDFSAKKNEEQLHSLLKGSPWLIDPTFWQFLTSNVSEKTLSQELSKVLGIDDSVPDGYDSEIEEESAPLKSNLRPDLTFCLGNYSLNRIVIVELKAPNTPLHGEHLQQLLDYMRDAREWLATKGGRNNSVVVEGYLIGTRAKPDSTSRQVKRLRDQEKRRGLDSDWKVLDISELLQSAEDAHREWINVYEAATKGDAVDED